MTIIKQMTIIIIIIIIIIRMIIVINTARLNLAKKYLVWWQR